MKWLYRMIVLAASLIIVGEKLLKLSDYLMEKTYEKSQAAIAIPFALWWEDGPRDTATRTIWQTMESEERKPTTEAVLKRLRSVRKIALMLAHSVHIEATDQESSKLTIFGRTIQLVDSHHEARLDMFRAYLLDHGIDPKQMEAHFAPTS